MHNKYKFMLKPIRFVYLTSSIFLTLLSSVLLAHSQETVTTVQGFILVFKILLVFLKSLKFVWHDMTMFGCTQNCTLCATFAPVILVIVISSTHRLSKSWELSWEFRNWTPQWSNVVPVHSLVRKRRTFLHPRSLKKKKKKNLLLLVGVKYDQHCTPTYKGQLIL